MRKNHRIGPVNGKSLAAIFKWAACAIIAVCIAFIVRSPDGARKIAEAFGDITSALAGLR